MLLSYIRDYDEIQNNTFSQEEQKMKFVCVKGFIQTKRGIIEIFKQMRAGYDERTFNCKRPKYFKIKFSN